MINLIKTNREQVLNSELLKRAERTLAGRVYVKAIKDYRKHTITFKKSSNLDQTPCYVIEFNGSIAVISENKKIQLEGFESVDSVLKATENY